MKDIAIALRALADPLRRGLFERLALAGEMQVKDLTAGSGVSQPAVSQHLKVLRDAGLVIERRKGRCAYYYALPEGLFTLQSWLQEQARNLNARKKAGGRE